MFSQPRSANSPTMPAIAAGPRSYWPISFGRPALGWQLIQRERNLLQRFQMRPHQLGAERAVHADREHREMRDGVPKRFDAWPETNVAPPLSNVPETITGTRSPLSSK